MEWTNESYVDKHVAKLNRLGVDTTRIKERSFKLKTDTLEFLRCLHYGSPVGPKAESIFWGIMWNPKSPPKYFMKPKNGNREKIEIFPTFEFQNTIQPKYYGFARACFVSSHTDGVLPWQRCKQRRIHPMEDDSDEEDGNNDDNSDEEDEYKNRKLLKIQRNFFMYPSAVPSLKLGQIYGLWNTKGSEIDLYWEWKSNYNWGNRQKQFMGFTYDPNVDFMYTKETLPLFQTDDDILMVWELLNSLDTEEVSLASFLIQSMSNPYRTPWATVLSHYMEVRYFSILYKEIEKRKMIPLYTLRQKLPLDPEEMRVFKEWYRKMSEAQGTFVPISGEILANYRSSHPSVYRQPSQVNTQSYASRSDIHIQEEDRLKNTISTHQAGVQSKMKDGVQIMQFETGYESEQYRPTNPSSYEMKEQSLEDKKHWLYGIPSPDSPTSSHSRSPASTETTQLKFANEMKSAFTEKQYNIQEYLNKALNACTGHNWWVFFTPSGMQSDPDKTTARKQENLKLDLDNDDFEIVMELQPLWPIPHQLMLLVLQYELFDNRFKEELLAQQLSREYEPTTESEPQKTNPNPRKRPIEDPSNQESKKNKPDDGK